MKKIFSFLLVAVLGLSFAACGKNDNKNNNAGGMVSDGMSAVESGMDSVASGAESVVDSAKNTVSDTFSITAKITAQEARAAALRHAGLSEDKVTDVDVDLDRDNGRLIYEIDFNSGGIEYDYDVDAATGEIISADRDRD